MEKWESNYITLAESIKLMDSKSGKGIALQWVNEDTGEIMARWLPKKLVRFNEDIMEWEMWEKLYIRVMNEWESGANEKYIFRSQDNN